MKKVLILLTALCLALSFTSVLAQEEYSRAPLDVSITQVLFSYDTGHETVLGEMWQDAIEKQLGREVNITWQYIPLSDYVSKMGLLINTNNLSDIVTVTNATVEPFPGRIFELGDSGMFADLSQYDIPNIRALFEKCGPNIEPFVAPSGALYIVPPTTDISTYGNASAYYGIAIRKDVLDENDLACPATIDELVEVSKKLKEIYPDSTPILDGNGFQRAYCGYNLLFRTDLSYAGYDPDAGEYVCWPLTEKYHDYLRFMHELYENELIPADYSAWNTDMARAAVLNDEAFIISTYTWGQFDGEDGKQWGDNEWLMLHYGLHSDKIKGGWYMSGLYDDPDYLKVTNWSVLCVNAQSDKVADVVEFLDANYVPEIQDMYVWGAEGITYEVDSEGQRHFLAEIGGLPKGEKDAATGMSGRELVGFDRANGFGIRAANTDIANLTYNDDFAPKYILTPDGDVVFMSQLEYATKNIDADHSMDIKAKVPDLGDKWEEVDEIYSYVGTYLEECRAKFINGTMDVEKDWDSYVETARSMADIDTFLKIFNDNIVGLDMR